MTDLLNDNPRRSWGDSMRLFFTPKVLALLFLGFSAGVPLYLVFSTLSVWLREAGVERATIGFFSWAALAYGFKFVWAPLVDKLPVPVLSRLMGQRRSWLLVAQFSIIGALAFMALTNPAMSHASITAMAIGAVLLAFSSATQDIVIDAYRIECAEPEVQGLLSATYIVGYRIGMIVAGAGALELAGFLDVIDGYDYNAWRSTYFAMGGVMGIGVLTTFVISEPAIKNAVAEKLTSTSDYVRFALLFAIAATMFVFTFVNWPGTLDLFAAALGDGLAKFIDGALRLGTAVGVAFVVGLVLVKVRLVQRDVAYETYVAPFAEFFTRFGRAAILILCLIATYRISDIVMGVMANVFYIDLGFDKETIGRIAKGFGLFATVVGGLIGGLFTARYGVMRIMSFGAVLVIATNALFAVMSHMEPLLWVLIAVIMADNLAGGIASAVFVAYLSGLTSKGFTATQYALFSSIMLLVPKLIAGYSGVAVDSVGYAWFFLGSALIGVIPLILVFVVARLMPSLATKSD